MNEIWTLFPQGKTGNKRSKKTNNIPENHKGRTRNISCNKHSYSPPQSSWRCCSSSSIIKSIENIMYGHYFSFDVTCMFGLYNTISRFLFKRGFSFFPFFCKKLKGEDQVFSQRKRRRKLYFYNFKIIKKLYFPFQILLHFCIFQRKKRITHFPILCFS